MSRSWQSWVWAPAVFILLLTAYLDYGGGSLLFLLITVGFLWIQGLYTLTTSSKRITIHRAWSPAAPAAGDYAVLTLHIHFTGGLPPIWVCAEDTLAAGAGRSALFTAYTGFRRSIIISRQVYGLQRGVYPPTAVQLTYGDLFGWFKRTVRVPGLGSLIVLPNPMTIGSMQTIAEAASQAQSMTQVRETFTGARGDLIREYSSGESWKNILWKASSRRSILLSRLPVSGVPAENLVLLAADPLSYAGSPESFEKAVSCAAALIYQAKADGSDIQLQIGGREPANPEGLDEIVMLAAAKLDDSFAAYPLLIEAVQEHSRKRITLITGTLNEFMVTAAVSAGSRGIVLEIICTGDAAGDRLEPERLDILRKAGIPVFTMRTEAGSAAAAPAEVV